MTNHTSRLNVLQKRGFKCERPNFLCHPVNAQKEPVKAVMLEGSLWGNEKVIYLCVSDGLVLVTPDGRDVSFEEFLKWLDMDCDPLDVPVRDDRQKTLFGEED